MRIAKHGGQTASALSLRPLRSDGGRKQGAIKR